MHSPLWRPVSGRPVISTHLLSDRAAGTSNQRVHTMLKYYTTKDAAGILGIKPSTVAKMVREGIFPNTKKPGKKYLIPEEDIKDYLGVNVVNTPPPRLKPNVKQFIEDFSPKNRRVFIDGHLYIVPKEKYKEFMKTHNTKKHRRLDRKNERMVTK